MGDFKIDRLPAPSQLDSESHYGNRRKEPRSKLSDGLDVRVRIPPEPETLEGELFDVTSGGARIMMAVALRLGTIITFQCGAQRVYAEVKYCRAGTTGYSIGVKISDAVEESQ
jgi:PilZ domain